MDAKTAGRRLVLRLQFLIRRSRTTQRQLEDEAGFARGHLSQLLNCHVEMKCWQLLAILDAIDARPVDLFGELFTGSPDGLEAPHPAGRRQRDRERPQSLALGRLFAFGVEVLREMHARLEACERTLES